MSMLTVSRSIACLLLAANSMAFAQSLDEELRRTPLSELVQAARASGDAARGAVVFFQPYMACAKCHAAGHSAAPALGPDLTTIGREVSDEAIVESVLLPSKVIRQGYQSVTAVTATGQTVTGLLVERTPDQLVLRDIARGGELTKFNLRDLDDWKLNDTSIMPAGQVNALHSRQQFLDLLRYLFEIREGGAVRALQLQPPAALLTFAVPEYEQHLDHAGLIGDWNEQSRQRGEAIYQRVCANCHGTLDRPGSLPTSLRFAEGRFKNGSDPLSMYRTLTHGFGLMAPQTWMVPTQKYDVIHYIRETYLKNRNPSQFVAVDASYLQRLPAGDTRGPEPSQIVPWSAMDYGPSLTHTFEVPGLTHNLAYKGIAMRLDPGAGGVSRGRHWILFDTDTLRVAAAWNGTGNADDNFIDWHGIQFDGAHGVHPRLVGQTAFTNATGPGWANPSNGEFADEQRVLGRDGRRYGPLPRDWGRFRGLYHHGQDVVLSYSVGTTDLLEWPRLIVGDAPGALPLVARTFNIGPRDRDLLLQVAEHPSAESRLELVNAAGSVVRLAPPGADDADDRELRFDGNTYLEVTNGERFDLTTQDFTIVARLRTRADGTVWSLCEPGPKWTPNGQSFFIRGGRLAFDIGWVGAVSGKTKIDDGQWHAVAISWQREGERVRLYVDGRLDGEGRLAARAALPQSVARIGFTTPDFPRPATFFQGEISEVRFYQSRLSESLDDLQQLATDEAASLQGRWVLSEASGATVADTSPNERAAEVRRGMAPARHQMQPLIAGFAPTDGSLQWTSAQGRLQLRIPAGRTPLRFTLWLPADSANARGAKAGSVRPELINPPIPDADRDLTPLTRGGPPRWPQKLETQLIAGADDGPFATDILTPPEDNPWLAQTRFTGLDFLPDGRIAVCTWDGDVWLVEAAAAQPPAVSPVTLRWQRIASGMFQPLGLKVVEGRIHVICRDQLTVLQDLNQDGEIDFYECLNNDHQVTEHFHEFAMGLQTDAAGNFYYAKSGCHGKAAVVPQHGTLLRVSRDGSRTEILANGFRAANGVCLNPDGSFLVTDQEGFWNPKNRINWVTLNPDGRPNFYGNMLGYHDVTDTSDAAMVPPLCWITNAFDRSPAELLWVTSDRWGPLQGSLLNLSYGYGKVFLVLHEQVDGLRQGGMIELPIPVFPTGVMRGRFQPTDGHLYLCGMFAWAGNATHPGGLYRLRATGRPVHLPVQLQATRSGVRLTFTEPLDPASLDVQSVQVKTWSLQRTANYGSKHINEQPSSVRALQLSNDARTLTIDIADLRPTWCMEIVYALRSADGAPVTGTIHNTIHALGD